MKLPNEFPLYLWLFTTGAVMLALAFGADAAECNQWQCHVDTVFVWCWESDACVLAWGIAI